MALTGLTRKVLSRAHLLPSAPVEFAALPDDEVMGGSEAIVGGVVGGGLQSFSNNPRSSGSSRIGCRPACSGGR